MRRLYDLCGNVFLMVEHRRLKAAHIRKWKHANQNIVECKKIKDTKYEQYSRNSLYK